MSRNPLESLGVPKYIVAGIWGDTSLTEAQRVDLLMEVIKQVHRGLNRGLHPDKIGQNPYTPEITEAYEDIEPDILPAIISRYITTSDIQRERDAQETAAQVSQARRRAAALLPFLGLVDWRQLVGDGSPVELAFGLPENLWDSELSYMSTYLLECMADSQLLARLPHPFDGDTLVPLIARFSNAPIWRDGEWQVDDFDYTAGPRTKPKTFHFGEPQAVSPVRLVGQVRPEAMYALASSQGARPNESRPGSAVPILAGVAPSSTISEKLVWWEPFGTWWLTGLEPRLEQGNYAVVARGEGVQLRLAVIGRYLAARPLA